MQLIKGFLVDIRVLVWGGLAFEFDPQPVGRFIVCVGHNMRGFFHPDVRVFEPRFFLSDFDTNIAAVLPFVEIEARDGNHRVILQLLPVVPTQVSQLVIENDSFHSKRENQGLPPWLRSSCI